MNRLPELGTLRAELRAAGVFETRELRNWLKFFVLLTGVAACLTALAVFGPWAGLIAVPVAAVFGVALAMFGHEGSHRSFSKSPFRNSLVVHFAFPLFSGLGALYWHNKHDRLHHGHPNVEGVDPDIKPFPFVSSRGDHEKCGPGERWFQRTFQRYAFWPMSTLMAMGIRRSSILYLVRYPKKHGFSRVWFVEAACLAGHYVFWLVVPSLIWGPLIAFAVYFAIWGLVGISLALIFAPAHIGLPIMSEQNNDWLHQLETTRDLQLPKFISFFFIGLDYQAEHHLFPKITHQQLPLAARITADWCKRHGIEYLSVPYLEALVDSAKFMADAWQRDAIDPMHVRVGLVGADRAA